MLDFAIRGVGVYVQKVEMIFDHDSVHEEYSVVMLVLVDFYPVFRVQQFVRLPLFAIEPDVDVATGTMLRYGVQAAQE